MDDVEHDFALVHGHRERVQVTALGVAPPDADLGVVRRHLGVSSKKAARSAGIFGSAWRVSATEPWSSLQMTLSPPHSVDGVGKSSRVWPPRLSCRSSAAFAMHSETVSMLGRSSARCQPGL